ncbi:MAG: tetratricopeptide repeat protein, partial [Verrucomicrobiota bacterium]
HTPLPGSSSSSDQSLPFARTEKPDATVDAVEAHAHYGTALILEMRGETEPALAEFYEAAIRDLDNEALILEVSRRLLQGKQTEKALELVSRATERPKASGNLFARLGFIYFQSGQGDLAIRANRTAIKREPRSLVGYQNLFLIHVQNKNPQEALKVLDDAARVPNTSSEFLIGLSELYVSFSLQNPAQRDTARARGLAVLQRAAKSASTDLQLRLRLADGFNMLGQDQPAAEIYQDVLKQTPDVPMLRENIRAKLTDIYIRSRDHQRANEQLENLVRENPTDAQANYFLGSIAYSDTNYTKAVESFSKVILLDPEFEQAYYDLASAQLSSDQMADALATLEKAREKFPQKFFAEYLTGLAFSQKKDFTNAVNHFTAAEVIAQATDPKQLSDSFYFQIGSASERKGDYVQAEKYFEKCLELSPHLSEAQNYLGYMLAERGEQLERARSLIENALQAEPKNEAYLDSMGWVLFKLNRPKEALGYILESIKISPEEDATLYDHLGDVYSALDQPEKAQDAWRKSLSLEPNPSVVRKLSPPSAQGKTAQ